MKPALAAIAAIVAMSISSAAGATTVSTNGWVVQISGMTFTGTFTNQTASVVNGIAMGTQDKAQNPIISLTFQGQTCSLYAAYGSAFCYVAIDVEPGKSATFSGEAEKAIGAGGIQACSSADKGMDNTCNDVTSTTNSTGSSVGVDERKQARALTASINSALRYEELALTAYRHGNEATGRTELHNSMDKLATVGTPGSYDELPPAAGRSALDNVLHARSNDKDVAGTSEWEVLLPAAIKRKQEAIATLRKFTH